MLACVGLGLLARQPSARQNAKLARRSRDSDDKAIKQVAEDFKRAFNAGDAKAVAALYTDDAEMIDEFGEKIQGRPSIQDFYSALFTERKGATIEICAGNACASLDPTRPKETGQITRQTRRRRTRDGARLHGSLCETGGALAAFERPRRVPRQTGASRATQGAGVDDR